MIRCCEAALRVLLESCRWTCWRAAVGVQELQQGLSSADTAVSPARACRLTCGADMHVKASMPALTKQGPPCLQVDMLVGDIYGKDRDYSNIGLSATTIASSFGKVVAEGKDLEDLDPADLALALCRWELLERMFERACDDPVVSPGLPARGMPCESVCCLEPEREQTPRCGALPGAVQGGTGLQ